MGAKTNYLELEIQWIMISIMYPNLSNENQITVQWCAHWGTTVQLYHTWAQGGGKKGVPMAGALVFTPPNNPFLHPLCSNTPPPPPLWKLGPCPPVIAIVGKLP